MTTDGEWVRLVQRRALERALVDDVDARRYFALAGSLDAARDADGATTTDVDPPSDGRRDGTVDVEGVLPAAMLSLAVVRFLDDPGTGTPARSSSPSPSVATPPTAPTPDPWSPVDDPSRPAVRRGARLALRWFDVSTDRVAARAGLSEATLTAPGE